MPHPSDLGFLLCAALTLAPSPGQRIERNSALDITRVKSARCEYRGITASFEELTRDYRSRTSSVSRGPACASELRRLRETR